MFSLLVSEGWNIFSKQNKERLCPPRLCPLNVAKPSLLNEIWIRYVNRKENKKIYTNNSFHHSFKRMINSKCSLNILKSKQLVQLHLVSVNWQPTTASFTLPTKAIVWFYSRNACDRKQVWYIESDPKWQKLNILNIFRVSKKSVYLSNTIQRLWLLQAFFVPNIIE